MITNSKGKGLFEDYNIPVKNIDKILGFENMGGLFGSMAVFITIKPTLSKVEIRELEMK